MADYVRETERQIAAAVSALGRIEELKPDVWQRLGVRRRLVALRQAENAMATIQDRTAVPVTAENLEPGEFGAFDGNRIVINRKSVFEYRRHAANRRSMRWIMVR